MSRQEAFGIAITALWVVWLLYWFISARDVKATRWRDPARSRILYRAPTLITALLLFGNPGWLPVVLRRRFVPEGDPSSLLAMVAVAAGLAFAVWARRHLGRNWSATVTVKEGHSLVRSGPYRFVRHPIYSGVLVALSGSVLAVGEWRGLVALGFAVLAFVVKVRLEEDRMRATFVEYEEYRKRTSAIVPGVW